jgi:hypothetical protein
MVAFENEKLRSFTGACSEKVKSRWRPLALNE